jgi:hypothetical protein
VSKYVVKYQHPLKTGQRRAQSSQIEVEAPEQVAQTVESLLSDDVTSRITITRTE